MLAERLRELRLKKRLTQKELASSLNVRQQTIAKWENKNAEPSIDNLQALADHYNCSIDYLLGRTNDPQTYLKILPSDQGDILIEKTSPDELTPDEIAFVRYLKETYMKD